MNTPLRLLIIEDYEKDAQLLIRTLRREGIELYTERVDDAKAMEEALERGTWDLAISDCHMPRFSVERALEMWQRQGGDQPFIVVSGAIGEEQAVALLKAGAHDFVKKENLARLVPAIERELRDARERQARKAAEEALKQSETRRVQLQTELNCAAEMQKLLLPQGPLLTGGFEIAAYCQPARQIGGDFYDWYETAPGILTIAFGDVMGKGLGAAMLMTTVRATLRAVTLRVQPSIAVQYAERSLRHDLNGSGSFVTLFLARLNVEASLMTYVDCGHGYSFLRRRDGSVEELLPRGLPLGVLSGDEYQEGGCAFGSGDALVVYSDGVVDAVPELRLDPVQIAARLEGATHAQEMVERVTSLTPRGESLADDLTVMAVLRS